MSGELEIRKLNKSESWELTDEIRQGFVTIHENRLAQVDRLARAYEGHAWEAMGYDSFEEYKAEEFGDDLRYQRLEIEERITAVRVLTDSGMAKVEIADILGIHRNSVTNLLKRIDAPETPDAQRCASNEVDAAGQSVEEAGHIDDDKPQPLTVIMRETSSEEEEQQIWESNNVPEDDDKRDGASWLDEINFEAMILPTSNQIVSPQPSAETPEFFTPRPVVPSWSPPEVRELPPPPAKRYDDPEPEFLEPPLKLPKTQEPTQGDSKHCVTCNCNMLP